MNALLTEPSPSSTPDSGLNSAPYTFAVSVSPAVISLVYCCLLLEYLRVCGFLTIHLFTGEETDETSFPGHRAIKEQCHSLLFCGFLQNGCNRNLCSPRLWHLGHQDYKIGQRDKVKAGGIVISSGDFGSPKASAAAAAAGTLCFGVLP